MSRSKSELQALAKRNGWTISKNISLSDVNRWSSDQMDYNCQFGNLQLVESLLNPSPAPPPPTEKEIRSVTADKVATELTAEYTAWLAKNKVTSPNQLSWDQFMVERTAIKRYEVSVQKWLTSHPEFIVSDSNRTTINSYLSEHDLEPTFENLEAAFAATRSSLAIDENKVVDPDRPETRAGVWRNGIFTPFDTSGSGTVRSALVGQLDPSKVVSGEKQITKRVSQQSASEFLRNLNESPSFHKKMDDSLL